MKSGRLSIVIVIAVVIAIGLSAPSVRAQSDDGLTGTHQPERPAAQTVAWDWAEAADAGRARVPQSPGPSVAGATAFSALIPGAGQHLLGQKRKWVYGAIEVVGWILYLDSRSQGFDLRDNYRDFAWNQARLRSGPRVDGGFDYYETLSKWGRSGAFDDDAGMSGVQPEVDPTAFNGMIWTRATQLFLPGGATVPVTDPSYQRAIAYYGEHAYGSQFLWDWSGSGTARDEYGGIITDSDAHFRRATNVLGVLIANHVISAVDGFLSARGRASRLGVRVMSRPGPTGAQWVAALSLPAPR